MFDEEFFQLYNLFLTFSQCITCWLLRNYVFLVLIANPFQHFYLMLGVWWWIIMDELNYRYQEIQDVLMFSGAVLYSFASGGA